jgi:hypothetical protein
MKKLQLVNLIIVSLITFLSLIFLAFTGFKEIIYSLQNGHYDDLLFGIPQLVALIFGGIYLTLGIKFYKSERESKLVNLACWTNILGTILTIILVIVIIGFTINCNSVKTYDECDLGGVIGIFASTYLWIILAGISIISFLIGYFKKD